MPPFSRNPHDEMRQAVVATGVSTYLNKTGRHRYEAREKGREKNAAGREEREGDECRASKTPDHMQIRGTDAARNVRARIIPDRFFCWTRDLN